MDASGTPEYQRAVAEREALAAAQEQVRAHARALYEVDGQPSHRDSFAVFLDVLGTTAATTGDDGRLRELLDLERRLRGFLYDDDWDDDHHRIVSFSDNVLIGGPVAHHPFHPHGGLFHYANAVALYQFNTTVHGLFLRGGFERGPLFVDDVKVAGPALVDAYHLENTVANVPRVIVGPKVRAMLEADMAYSRSGPSDLESSLLALDRDGQVFVNYIIASAADGDIPPGKVERGLRLHHEAVLANLRAGHKTSVHAKYEWVARYHNQMAPLLCPGADLQIPGFGLDPDSIPPVRPVPRPAAAS